MSVVNIIKDNQVMLPPGDLIDRHVILNIKLKKASLLFRQTQADLVESNITQNKLAYILDELSRLDEVLDNIYTYHHNKKALSKLIKELHNINLKQWDWEDRVRSEQSTVAAVNARECNTKRVEVKNRINQLFNYPLEIKMYAKKEN